MIALVMLDEIFLPVENPVAAVDDTWPVLSSLMHPHLMFFPVRLCFESLLALLFGAIGTEHERLTRLTLRLVIIRD
jgi:hypothetical protein